MIVMMMNVNVYVKRDERKGVCVWEREIEREREREIERENKHEVNNTFYIHSLSSSIDAPLGSLNCQLENPAQRLRTALC